MPTWTFACLFKGVKLKWDSVSQVWFDAILRKNTFKHCCCVGNKRCNIASGEAKLLFSTETGFSLKSIRLTFKHKVIHLKRHTVSSSAGTNMSPVNSRLALCQYTICETLFERGEGFIYHQHSSWINICERVGDSHCVHHGYHLSFPKRQDSLNLLIFKILLL